MAPVPTWLQSLPSSLAPFASSLDVVFRAQWGSILVFSGLIILAVIVVSSTAWLRKAVRESRSGLCEAAQIMENAAERIPNAIAQALTEQSERLLGRQLEQQAQLFREISARLGQVLDQSLSHKLPEQIASLRDTLERGTGGIEQANRNALGEVAGRFASTLQETVGNQLQELGEAVRALTQRFEPPAGRQARFSVAEKQQVIALPWEPTASDPTPGTAFEPAGSVSNPAMSNKGPAGDTPPDWRVALDELSRILRDAGGRVPVSPEVLDLAERIGRLRRTNAGIRIIREGGRPAWIMALGGDSPVVIEERAEARVDGFRVPSPAAEPPGGPSLSIAGLMLDSSKIIAIERETREAADLLRPVFAEANETEPKPKSLAGDGVRFPGLDPEHALLVEVLSAAEVGHWSRADFEARARKLGLMPDGAIETINEWAFDNFGEPLIEDGAPLTINLGLISRPTEGRHGEPEYRGI